VSRDDVDAVRLEDDWDRIRARGEDPDGRRDALGALLDAWQSAAYAGCDDGPLTDAAARLDRIRVAVVAERIEADQARHSARRRDDQRPARHGPGGDLTGVRPSCRSARLARGRQRHRPFAVHLLQHWLDTGRLDVSRGSIRFAATSGAEARLRGTLRDIVWARLRALGPDAPAVLAAATVLGGDIAESSLLDLVDLDPDAVATVVDNATRPGILTDSHSRAGAVRFTHALIASAVDTDLPTPRRRRLHERAARSLEQTGGRSLRTITTSRPSRHGGIVTSSRTKASVNLNFWIFPEPVDGHSSTQTQNRGVLCGARRSRTNVLSVASSGRSAPEARMKHATCSPQVSSGIPTTAHSVIASCSSMTFSISAGNRFSPLRMIISFTRPVILR